MSTALRARAPLTNGPLDEYLDALTLARGSHPSPDSGACIMEAVAFVAGAPWSDHPLCASRVIAAFLRAWNDGMNDEDRQQLKPLIPRLIGSDASPAVERRRAWMALDWRCRAAVPIWLRSAGLEEAALALENTAAIVDVASAKAAESALARARSEARVAKEKAGEAWEAGAAWAAWEAWEAGATWEAWEAWEAWAAWEAWEAWEAGAAWAAWEAGAAGATWEAWEAGAAGDREALEAAIRARLRPTVVELQASALQLVDRMLAVTERRRRA